MPLSNRDRRSQCGIGKKLRDQLIYGVRLVCIGVVTGVFEPNERNAGVAVPGFVIADTGTGTVFFPAEQK